MRPHTADFVRWALPPVSKCGKKKLFKGLGGKFYRKLWFHYIKIYWCYYPIVPSIRGKSRSAPRFQNILPLNPYIIHPVQSTSWHKTSSSSMKFSVLYSSCTVSLSWDLHICWSRSVRSFAEPVVKSHGCHHELSPWKWKSLLCWPLLAMSYCTRVKNAAVTIPKYGCIIKLLAMAQMKGWWKTVILHFQLWLPVVVAIPILSGRSPFVYCSKSIFTGKNHVFVAHSSCKNPKSGKKSWHSPNRKVGKRSTSRGRSGKIMPLIRGQERVRCNPQQRVGFSHEK